MKRLFFLIVCALGINALNGQVTNNFFLNGAARSTNDTCYLLTNAAPFEVGSIWNADKIDLNRSFELILDINLGCLDGGGADGMGFVLQPVSTSIGTVGEGMGFQDVAPSIAVEFDTYQNGNLDDPIADHIAIIRDGLVNHSGPGNVAGPVPILASSDNIEDCTFHSFRITWDVELFKLTVFVDCEERISTTIDLVNDVFNGDSEVFWGFTAATGGFVNEQTICLSYTTFENALSNVTICPGGKYELEVQGGVRYNWEPATFLSDPSIPNPIATPDSSMTYVVEIRDFCGFPFYDTVQVAVNGDTIFFDLPPDTTICIPETLVLDASNPNATSYTWSDGTTNPILTATESGYYEVTVVVDDVCVSSDWLNLTVLDAPAIPILRDTIICQGQEVVLDATTPTIDTYEWENGSLLPLRTFTEAGSYSLLVENFCGKSLVPFRLTAEDCQNVFFPNIFSPNEDGKNDRFIPLSDGDVLTIVNWSIFNRWGAEVFSVTDTPMREAPAWDGTLNGERLNPDVFIWSADLIFIDGHQERFTGSIKLVR